MTIKIKPWAVVVLLVTGACLCLTNTPQALTAGQTVVLAGQALAGSDTLGNATITVTLVGFTCYTSADVMPTCSKTVTAASNGNWTVTLVGTDSITCSGSTHPTYTVEVSHSVLDKAGQQIVYNGLSIPATNGATTQLRTILAAQ